MTRAFVHDKLLFKIDVQMYYFFSKTSRCNEPALNVSVIVITRGFLMK